MSDKVTHEKRDLDYKGIVISNILIGVFIFITIIFFLILFFTYRDYQYKKNINDYGIDQKVKELKEYESRELNNYGFIDKEKKIVRIPIEQAIKEVVKEYNK